MLPGPYQIIACPRCKGLASYMTWLTGNTFDAQGWSDGKQTAPMMLRTQAVVKCHHCEEYYWLADAEEIGIHDPWDIEGPPVNPDWAEAESVSKLTEEEYYHAIDGDLAANSEQERSLRILAWWRSNDAFRDYFGSIKRNPALRKKSAIKISKPSYPC